MAATFYERDNYDGVYLSGLYSIYYYYIYIYTVYVYILYILVYILLAEFSVRNLQYERVFFHRFMAQARSLRIV